MAIIRLDSPLRLTLGYALFGTLWIVLSDGLVTWSAGEGGSERLVDSLKGLLFIGVTAGLLYGLTHRLVARYRRTERELRESRERWQLTLRSAGIGTWEWHGDEGLARYSTEWRAMLGYAEGEVPDRHESWLQLIHPEDRARVQQQLQNHVSGAAAAYECEYRMRAKDGSYRWIMARGLVTDRDAEGRARKAFGTHTDITDRRKAEAQTADTLAFARAVLHHSPVGVIVYGPEGNAVIANESAAGMIGTTVAGLLAQNFRRLDSWRASGLLAAAERALASGGAVVHRTTLTTSFGRTLQVEAHLVPFTFAGAQQLLLLLDDETSEHRAQSNLRLLDAAVQAAPSAWVITNAAGVVEWVNPAFTRLTGYASAEAVGQNPRLLRSGRHGEDFYRRLWETIRRGEVWSGEICNRRKDGTLYDEHMTIAPVRDPGGRILHFVAIKEDVSERKRLEQQLTRTQRLESIGMLASGIAHDLNNVLTPIMLSVELLKAKYPAADAAKYVDTVETAAKRGAGIVRQVLTFARGMDDGARTEVQPRYLLRDVVQLIEETFPRNIEVRYEVPRDIKPVIGDVTQLHQVILNLAVNARDAMPQGGILTLSAGNLRLETADPAHPNQPAGEYVLLTVADTGTGIPPEVQEHMFEPFYTTKPRGKGTGLGLSTVYGIVRSHGGVIDVRTELGRGSSFEVRLPVAQGPAIRSDPARVAPRIQGWGRRVLVVDDEESIRRITSRILARHGFVPVEAADGEEGLRQFRAAPTGTAAAVVDMMMPRMNGAELVRAIRATAPALPVLISTGLISTEADPGQEESLRALGVRTFLRKPYTEEDLLKALGEEIAAN